MKNSKKDICPNDVCMVGGKQRIKMSQNTKNVIHLSAVGLLLLISWLFGRMAILPFHLVDAFSLLAIFLGYPIYIKAAKSLVKGKIGVPLFVTIAEIASVAIGEYLAGGTVVFIILAGTYLEDFILDKTRGAIKKLIEMMPMTARVLKDGKESDVDVKQVEINDIVLVKPGEKIPVDGKVVSGYSAVDQSSITGESMPVDKVPGNPVFAGTFNQSGALKIKTDKVAEDTTLSRMIHLVEEAQEKKAPIQNIADRFTTYFLPAILILSGAVYVFSGSLVRAVTILLVACPCALALAVPIAVVGAIGNAGRRGILIKGGTFVERLQNADAVVFDKTGTLTYGKPKVTDIVCLNNNRAKDVLEIAAIAEKFSEHPLARAILDKANEAGIAAPDPEIFEATLGKGVIAQHGGQTILIGTVELMEEKEITVADEHLKTIKNLENKGTTVLLVVRDSKLIGLIAVRDVVKDGLSDEIASIRSLGMKRIAMLSGDNRIVSEAVADSLGIKEIASDLLPEEKVSYVDRLKKEGHVVVMVGDGVNDAPALACADIGMAMGTAGTDVAIEAADVALLGDELSKVRYTISLSRKAFQKMRANIVFAIIWNVIGLSLASMGYLTPILGAILQEAGCISVVINSSLLLFYKGDSR
ncbi:MAG: cadmium-translocating P-type ATPase [Nitrospirae bacterium]|nr:cadmium-translocating P-type ATPase [Nitrospirota bacterium]